METSKEKSADKRKRREGFMTHAYRLWAKCLYSMTKQLNVSARETFDGLFYPRDEFYSLLFLLPFFFPKFGSFWYSAKKIEIYIFFSLLLHFFVHIRRNLVSPAPGGWERNNKKNSYSDTILKTDYYLYSIDSFSSYTLLHLRPYVSVCHFFWYSLYLRRTQIPLSVRAKSPFSAFRYLCWFQFSIFFPQQLDLRPKTFTTCVILICVCEKTFKVIIRKHLKASRRKFPFLCEWTFKNVWQENKLCLTQSHSFSVVITVTRFVVCFYNAWEVRRNEM